MATSSPISPLFRLLTPLLHRIRPSTQTKSLHTITRSTTASSSRTSPSSRSFSTTPQVMARKDDKKPKKDPRITLIRYHMQHPKTPRPLRLSRMRALRHWTIHRAWMLLMRQQRKAEEAELSRMYGNMHNACEELRLLDGLESPLGSKLYRVAMEKKGIFGPNGVPIEYARAQTETPGKEPWNHGWTR